MIRATCIFNRAIIYVLIRLNRKKKRDAKTIQMKYKLRVEKSAHNAIDVGKID